VFTKAFAVSVAASIVAAGCAFEHATADQFAYINPPRFYQSSIKTDFEARLKDPESASYSFGAPAKAYANNGLARGGEVTWRGYAVPVSANAKNSYGGYTGNKEYIVLFNGENPVMDVTENQPLFHWLN
jgi:hypothetical protein